MTRVAERSQSMFLTSIPMVEAQPAQLPALPPPGLAQRFEQMRTATQTFSSDLVQAAQAVATDHHEAADANHSNKRWGVRGLASAGGLTLGTGAAIALGLTLFPLLITAGVAAIVGYGASEFYCEIVKSKEVKLLGDSSATNARSTLETLLARVHSDTTQPPTVVVALSSVAERWLKGDIDHKYRNTLSSLDEGQRKLLSKVMWRGEYQELAAVEQATRWLALLDGLEAWKAIELTDSGASQFKSVSAAFEKLEKDEKTALAPMVREALFDGEKPRARVSFDAASKLFASLAAADGASTITRAIPNPSEPAGLDPMVRLTGEILAFEAALASALVPRARSINEILRPHLSYEIHLVERRPQDAGKIGIDDLAKLMSATSTTNETVPADTIIDAVGRALASWHTPLERAGLAIVAQRYCGALDGCSVLGSETRSLLQRVIDEGMAAPAAGASKATPAMEDAQRVYMVLEAFNDIDRKSGSEKAVAKASALFDAILTEAERPGVARVLRDHIFGTEMSDDYFKGAVELFRKLRGAMEGRPRPLTKS